MQGYKEMLTSLFNNLKKPGLTTFFIFLSWFATLIISVIVKLIFGDLSDNIMNFNPFINGFIHGGWSHLIWNLSLIFIFLVPAINQHYTFTKVYFITLFISLIYFPISILTTLPAVGISGTMYFMMTRVCLNKKSIILYIFFAIMFGYDIANFRVLSDGTAHIVNIIGSVLGFISLHLKNTKFYRYTLAQIIT